MVDYVKLQNTAIRLIKSNGREITLVKLDETAADSAKPWQGPTVVNDASASLVTRGVFVPPNTVRQFGLSSLGEGTEIEGLLTHSEQVIIIAQGDVDVRDFSKVIDRGEEWGIIGYQVLRPGDLGILSFLGVRR